ncbi:PAS domain-containing protein [Spirosoma sp.]|uniref:PAS domain-containing protein n=1 Tax=Spirosoma sp. TaxID=1899569 RepID=UPI00262899E7|nr:PAS domain-containing protein [Spirosoma sp.]MCX6213683.1 PAS domain-containing protein [Spirosoma sp.]
MTGDQWPFDLTKKLTERLDVDLAIQAAGLGLWEVDLITNQVRWDDRCRQLLGIDQNQIAYADTLLHIHPEDVERVNQAVQRTLNLQSDGRYQVTYRSIGQDGLTRWVQSTGRRYLDSAGQAVRFAGVIQDVTPQVEARQQAQRQQRISEAITASSPDLMYVFDLHYRFTYANQALLDMWGSSWEEAIGKGLLENGYEPWHARMHEREIDQVVATKQPIRGEVSFPHATLGKRIYDYVFAPVLNEQGEVEAVAGTTRDITDIRRAQERIQEGQRELLALFEESPVGLATIGANDQLVFEWANSFYAELVARPAHTLVGRPLLEALPELKDQGFDTMLKEVMATGIPFSAHEVAVTIRREAQLTTIYVDLAFQPRQGQKGEVTGLLVVVTDVTQLVISRQQIEESESKLRAILATAPAGIGVFVGRELVIENPNQTFIDIMGKGPHIVGKPLGEAVPELQREGQPVLQILDKVFTTGQPFISPVSLVTIELNGVLNENYYNISYSPICTAAGEVYAILTIAIDVTAQVKAQQALGQSEQHLQLLRDAVPAMIFYLDDQQRYQSYNTVFQDWFGVDQQEVLGKTVREFLGEAAYRQTEPHLARAYAGQSERYELLAPSRMKQDRWLSIVYTPHTNQAGQVVGLIVLATDITPNKRVEAELRGSEERYRQLSAALEEQVRQRTLALTAANEALSTSNKELEETNSLLNRSNANLQQFAYVASHDLQEPLRKIQQFGDLLKTRYTDSTGEAVVYLERMQLAASRMSTLIRDLLDYSRISTRRDKSAPVCLQTIVATVLNTLDWTIQQTGAQIQVDPLPTLSGDASQLGQLFQNLLSNALKFSKPGVTSLIQIRSARVSSADLPKALTPHRAGHGYYRVDVVDNGIGFEEKYLDRIFQVFQRLHGKSAYAGTGIGLAICEKVVANHGGAITATSQSGQGATFSVYLPS